jgi:threonine aldolase
MYFSSENFDKGHPKIVKALLKANQGYAPSYGNDAITQKTIESLKAVFGCADLEAFFCFNGTGANTFALSAITEKHASILCADVAHIYVSESTALEALTGCRLFPIKTNLGKIAAADLLLQLSKSNGVHFPTPSVLTITQPTEYGTVYTLEELQVLSVICKTHHLLLHIDGARLFNAIAALGCSLKDFITSSGVDVLTLGGTKSGLLFGEAVLFFSSYRFKNLASYHKRSLQLASKNRFIAAQFAALLEDELWKKIATHTNALARYFEQQLLNVDTALLAHPVETNMVFLKMKPEVVVALQKSAHFYSWNAAQEEVRFVFSFSTTKKDIAVFFKYYLNVMASNPLLVKA